MSDDSVVHSVPSDDAERRNAVGIPPLRQSVAALELEIMKVRDWAASQGTHLGDLRHKLERAAIDDRNHRDHIARLEEALAETSKRAAQADRLRRELESVRASTTWRAGRVVLGPVRALKSLLRRG